MVNILILCWKRYSSADAILAGRNPNALIDNELWATYIIEVEPIGNDSMRILWEGIYGITWFKTSILQKIILELLKTIQNY